MTPPVNYVGDLTRLIKFLTHLARVQAFANVRLVIQRGRIEFIHVDRTYRPETLPLTDDLVSPGEKVNPPA